MIEILLIGNGFVLNAIYTMMIYGTNVTTRYNNVVTILNHDPPYPKSEGKR